MAKLFNILAASVGSGLLLGASIRLGEALGNKLKAGGVVPAQRRHANPVPAELINRLDQLEEKLSQTLSARESSVAEAAAGPEWQSAVAGVVAGVVARIDRQQSDVESIRQQVSRATRALDSVGDLANHLRGDLQKELNRSLDERLGAVEARVHLNMEAAHAQTLDAMVSAMENRVTPRIVRMENQIAGQTAAVTELRECALQSERSVQRLVGVLERMMTPTQNGSKPTGHGAAPQNRPQPGNSPAQATQPFPAGQEAPAPSFALFSPIS